MAKIQDKAFSLNFDQSPPFIYHGVHFFVRYKSISGIDMVQSVKYVDLIPMRFVRFIQK